jgi:hypothetical protein
MIELGIVLAAYKASFAFTHLVVNWTMDKIGFWLLLPIILATCVVVVFYTREGCVGCYLQENEGIELQPIERENPVPDDEGVMRKTGPSFSELLGNVADTNARVEHEPSRSRPGRMTGMLGISRLVKSRSSFFLLGQRFAFIYFTSPVKLLKISYFFSVYATCFLDPWAFPIGNKGGEYSKVGQRPLSV